IEYTKDIQVGFESGMLFNMGQLLSVPFVALGIWCMMRARK
ncbi:MAG: prolipoprotein diacylglyceryl transferase, partial [Prevotella oris]|nr:prolipoprotein diacylglyceryl transferase [Segatella oris]